MQNENRAVKELTDVINIIDKYQGNAYALSRAEQYVKKALDALEVITDQEKKQPLITLAEFILERKS